MVVYGKSSHGRGNVLQARGQDVPKSQRETATTLGTILSRERFSDTKMKRETWVYDYLQVVGQLLQGGNGIGHGWQKGILSARESIGGVLTREDHCSGKL